jgi:pyruvate ferredoxin oxidoreductase beta subunit
MEDGNITAVRKIKNKLPVADYLKSQKRYRHLFEDDRGQTEVQKLQAVADKNIETYGLMGVKTNEQNQSIDC